MKSTTRLGLATLLLAGGAHLAAQDAPQVSGLLQAWYTQMLDSSLRTNAKPAIGGYYNLRTEFQENSFNIRRTEIKVAGKIMDGITFEVMADPSIGTGSSNILQDAVIKYTPAPGLEFRIGQFKNQQTFEGIQSSSELIFAERSQMGRVYGDVRDRGVALSYSFGDPKAFGAKLTAGAFNGAGKVTDANAQKDFVLRLDLNLGTEHKFGLYTLQGSTDQADKGKLTALVLAGASAPTAAQVLDNKDKTTNLGAYYVFQSGAWHFDAEAITGALGRRNSTLGQAAGNAAREHLDQKFFGAFATAAYTTGAHSFALRYDLLNYNKGDDWYTAYNPYTTNAAGPLGADFSPRYTEITAGYTYAFNPKKVKAANIKLNYIARSKNFLKPSGAQTGEQGGDTLMAAFQVAF
ncbi:MAG: hypothetical protein KGN80_00775 [Acidobacteriota bacterium]|nr:hypothetical protein [Acidobacteriota bacterium]